MKLVSPHVAGFLFFAYSYLIVLSKISFFQFFLKVGKTLKIIIMPKVRNMSKYTWIGQDYKSGSSHNPFKALQYFNA